MIGRPDRRQPMAGSQATGYDEYGDMYAKLMQAAGWAPAPDFGIKGHATPRVADSSVVIIGGKPYVPGAQALRGSVLRRYLEAFSGPLNPQMDAESFVGTAGALGLIHAHQYPVTVDPVQPAQPIQSTQSPYDEYLDKLPDYRQKQRQSPIGFKRGY